MNAFILQAKPVGRIWGEGQRGDDGLPVGEWWLCSDYPARVTDVARGPARGLTIQDLMARYREDFWGEARAHERFPILVKQLCPRFALPLQVHPVEGRDRKNECWYVQTSGAGGWAISRWTGDDDVVARDLIGPNPATHLVRDVVTPGMLITVPAGSLHALGPEVVVLEIQDTADVTLRVSLWEHAEWNLELDVARATEEFLRMKSRPRVLQGTEREWIQQNWKVRIEMAETIRLDPQVPTVVLNGHQIPWQFSWMRDTQLVDGLEALLILPGQSMVIESLGKACDWLVCEAR